MVISQSNGSGYEAINSYYTVINDDYVLRHMGIYRASRHCCGNNASSGGV